MRQGRAVSQRAGPCEACTVRCLTLQKTLADPWCGWMPIKCSGTRPTRREGCEAGVSGGSPVVPTSGMKTLGEQALSEPKPHLWVWSQVFLSFLAKVLGSGPAGELDTGLPCSGCSYIACIRLVDAMMRGWGCGACNARKATYCGQLARNSCICRSLCCLFRGEFAKADLPGCWLWELYLKKWVQAKKNGSGIKNKRQNKNQANPKSFGRTWNWHPVSWRCRLCYSFVRILRHYCKLSAIPCLPAMQAQNPPPTPSTNRSYHFG